MDFNKFIEFLMLISLKFKIYTKKTKRLIIDEQKQFYYLLKQMSDT